MPHMRLSILALLTLTTSAVAEKPAIEEISLQRVLKESTAAIEALDDDPPTRSEVIEITPPGKNPDKDRWPPITHHLARVVVVAVLYDASGKLKPEDHLEIESANWQRKLDLHKKAYLQGVHKSLLYPSYVPSDAAAKADVKTRIYFLARKDQQWRFAIDGASEPGTDEVRAKIAKARKPK